MWAAIINTLIGLWLTFTPAVFQLAGSRAYTNYIIGPLIITFAVIAMWEINYSIIKINIFIALVLIVMTVVTGEQSTALYSDIISAVLIIPASLMKRKIKGSYGGGWKSLLQKTPAHITYPDA